MNLEALPPSLLSTLVLCKKNGGRITYKELRELTDITYEGAKRRIREAKRAGFLTAEREEIGQGKTAVFHLTPTAKDLLP